MDVANSINNIPIRLTDERWRHIVENHEDMAGYYDAVLQTVVDADYERNNKRGNFIGSFQSNSPSFKISCHENMDRLRQGSGYALYQF